MVSEDGVCEDAETGGKFEVEGCVAEPGRTEVGWSRSRTNARVVELGFLYIESVGCRIGGVDRAT